MRLSPISVYAIVLLAAGCDAPHEESRGDQTIEIRVGEPGYWVVDSPVAAGDLMASIAQRIEPGTERTRVIVRAESNVPLMRIVPVTRALSEQHIWNVRFELIGETACNDAVDYTLPADRRFSTADSRRVLAIRALVDKKGRVDYGKGPVELEQWTRWLDVATTPQDVRSRACELCMDEAMAYERFLAVLRASLDANIGIVWIRVGTVGTRDVGRLGSWIHEERIGGVPVVPRR